MDQEENLAGDLQQTTHEKKIKKKKKMKRTRTQAQAQAQAQQQPPEQL